MWRLDSRCHKPGKIGANYQNLGDKYGTDPSLVPLEGVRPHSHPDLRLPTSRTVRWYISFVWATQW